MRKFVWKILFSAFFISLLISCSKPNNGNDNQNKIIELQGFNVIVPQGFEGTGGHDGVKFVNTKITPKTKNPKYEIEVGYGIAATSSDFQGQMFVRGHYNNATVIPVDTEGWKSVGYAYTFIRTHGSDNSAFTKFDATKGPSQVMGLYRDGQWLEVELRAIEELFQIIQMNCSILWR